MCIINITNRRFFGSGVIFRTFIRRIRNKNKQKHTKKIKLLANSLDLKRIQFNKSRGKVNMNLINKYLQIRGFICRKTLNYIAMQTEV